MVDRGATAGTPVRWWIRILTLLAVLALVAAGCGNDDDGEAPDVDDEVTDDADPGDDVPDDDVDRDATLRVSLVVAPGGLDPNAEPNIFHHGVNRLLYDRLLMMDHSGTEVVPGLAESWEFSDDGLTLTLQLREDATFSDETPIRGDAVQFSIERAKGEESSNAERLAIVDSVEVVDPLTVNLHLSEATTMILVRLATSAGVVLNPEVVTDDVDLSQGPPPGGASGQYDVVEFIPEERLVVERNERPYWDPDAGRLKRIELQGIGDPAVVMNGLLAGELDVGSLLGADVARVTEQAEAAGDLEILAFPGRLTRAFWMNPHRPALEDERVRQAIAMGIDWELIVEGVMAEGAIYLEAQETREGDFGHLPDGGPLQYDPDRAQELLAEAGVSSLALSLVVNSPIDQRLAEAAAAELEPLGVTLEIEMQPGRSVYPEWREGRFDTTMAALGVEPILPAMFETFYLRGDFAGDRLPEIQEYHRRMTDPTLSEAEREEAAREGHASVLERAWRVPIGGDIVMWGHRENVHGVDSMETGAIGLQDFRYVYVTR